MHHGTETILFSLFLIFFGAAVMSTLTLFTRQSMLVGYMVVGALLGPFGFKLISNSTVIDQSGDIGIIFLLFLLGLHLHPQKLLRMLSKTILVAVGSSVVFAAVGYGISLAFGFNQTESFIIGLAMMFSSTIIGLKLLPTTVLHHQHTGEIVISVLLLQDLIAIVTLLIIGGMDTTQTLSMHRIILMVVALPVLLIIGYLVQRFVLIKLLAKFDRVQEYLFLLSIGWCLGMGMLAESMNLSAEVGAFIAGVAVATHPISQYIAESLKPLRDFFLVVFFFSIGAHFNIYAVPAIIWPALVLAAVMLILKPVVFRYLLAVVKEPRAVSWEVGWRLGQASEFSLLIAYLVSGSVMMSKSASLLIQATTILTFIATSYLVVFRYPSPLAFSERLRRD